MTHLMLPFSIQWLFLGSWLACFFQGDMSIYFHLDIIWVSKSAETLAKKSCSGYTHIDYKLTLISVYFAFIWSLIFSYFHCSSVDILNIISTCSDMLCVNINVEKRCVDHARIAISFKIHSLCGRFTKSLPQENVNHKCISLLDTSTWNFYTLWRVFLTKICQSI